MLVLVKVRTKLPMVFRFHWLYLIFGHISAYGTSLTRDQTHTPCNGSRVFITESPAKSTIFEKNRASRPKTWDNWRRPTLAKSGRKSW